MRTLDRPELNNVVLVVVEAAFEIEHVGFESAHQHGKGLLIHGRSHGGIDAEPLVLDQSTAAADADRQAAAAQMVEHADFLIEAQRVIERQHIDQGPYSDLARSLDRRRQKNTGARSHTKRRRMMLGEVIGVEARLLSLLQETQAILEESA